MPISPNMDLPISVIGSTPDPEWESNLNDSLTLIDSHNHDGAGNGVQLQPTAITFASQGFDFAGTVQSSASGYTILEENTSPFGGVLTGSGGLWVDSSGNLHYTSPTSDYILGGAAGIPITGSSNGFLGTDYNVNGGAASYQVAESGWPFQNTFYFYTAAGVPADDTGTRAGLAAAFLDLKGAESSTGAGIYWNPTNSGSTDLPFLGSQVLDTQSGEWGWNIGLASGGTTNYSPALTTRETSNSVAMSATHTSALQARTYGTYSNGSVAAATAIDNYALGARAVSYAGTGTTAAVPTAYVLAALANSSGVAQLPGNGFGATLDFEGQFAANFTSIATQFSIQSFWGDVGGKVGGLRLLPYGGGSPPTYGVEIVYAADGKTSLSVGQAPNLSFGQVLIGVPTNIVGTFNVLGTIGLDGTTTIAINTVIDSSGITSTIINGINGNFSGAVTATSGFNGLDLTLNDYSNVTPGSVGGVTNARGLITNRIIYTDTTSTSILNASRTNVSTGVNTITFPFTLNANAMVIPIILGNYSGTLAITAGGAGSNFVTVSNVTGPANVQVGLFVIGG